MRCLACGKPLQNKAYCDALCLAASDVEAIKRSISAKIRHAYTKRALWKRNSKLRDLAPLA